MQLKPKCFHKFLIVLLFSCCALIVRAQHADSLTFNPNKIYYWGGFHFGPGSYLLNAGLDGGMLLKNKFVVAVKTGFNINILFDNVRHIEADENALMVGLKLSHKPYSNWILLSGISTVWIKDRGEIIGQTTGTLFGSGNVYGDNKTYAGLGVPIALKYIVTPTGFFAMDFSAAANINSYRNYFSLTFGLAFGRVRSGNAYPPIDSDPRMNLPRSKKFGY